MTAWKGYLIRDVGGREEYAKAVAYAEALGVLRKQFESKGMFFVSRMDQMTGYFKNLAMRRREAGGSGAGSTGGGPSVA